jgi:poly-gamma-glutamate synthesis protein (capsule biosynthesis protein)
MKKKRKTRRRTKRKLKLGNIFIAISLCILFTLVVIYLTKGNDLKESTTTTSKKEEVKTEEEEKTYKASLITAGDNLIHSSLYKDANKNANYDGYDFKPMYELIKPIVSKYDIAYYNQETILGGTEIGLSDYPTFNSPQEVGDAMIDAGFNLVSLATNHTMDSGEKAVLESRKYWNKQTNVLAVGSYDSEEERNKVEVREVNNITYTMLNYTYGTNGMSVPTGKDYLVNVWPTDLDINDVEADNEYQAYKQTVKEDISRVRDKVDVLIVAMHWGVEYTDEPTEYEKDMAKYLSSLGVDVIIGTHPHVVQPVTWIDDTLVIYSLGNFISAQYQDENYNKMVGLMTSLEITKTTKGKESNVKIDNVNNELIYTYYKNYRNFKVIPFSNQEISNYLPNYKSVYETYKSVVQKYDSNMPVEAAVE